MHSKIIIYQVLPRLFGNTNDRCIPNSSLKQNGSGKLNDFTEDILLSIKDLGCTHIWFTGVIEHATQSSFEKYGIAGNHPEIVKGIAGSPYSITDYYDIAPSLSVNIDDRLTEFKGLVERCHKCDLFVIIDFVPNHISREYSSDAAPSGVVDFGVNDKSDYQFHPMNNFFYLPGTQFQSPVKSGVSGRYHEFPARVSGNDCITHSPGNDDWYETVKLNYGYDFYTGKEYYNPIPDTWHKMRHIVNFWLSQGVDGFRCDMAAMVPVNFWNWLINSVKLNFPTALFIAEIYEPEKYSLYLNEGKFDYLYDKVGLYDTLKGIIRKEKSASSISQCWQAVSGFEEKMLNFIENHDEVRVASDYFAGDPYAAIPAVAAALLLNRSPFLLYFGQELGERGMESEGYSGKDGKTSIFDYWSVSSVRDWLKGNSSPEIRNIYKRLLNISIDEESVGKGLKFDIQYFNEKSEDYDPSVHFSFFRKSETHLLLIVLNFSDKESNIGLNIPGELFSYFKMKEYELCQGYDLMTGESFETKLTPTSKIYLKIQKQGVKIIKLSL